MWKSVAAAPADSILGLTEAYKNDPNPHKVNLGVGVYMDNTGTTPILQCVKDAERILLGVEQSKSYLPISGDPQFGRQIQRLVFGEGSDIITNDRAATAHSPGGTGGLRIGAELIKRFRPEAATWISSPTWANHRGIFTAAGFPIKEYPYYDAASKGLRFEDLLATLNQVPAGDVVLLHACCHNPSGVDPDEDQWQKIAAVAADRGWLPFLDFAYQGLGVGIEADRTAVTAFAATGVDFFVASSFSKNFGLYNERTGAITVVSPTAEEKNIALSHLKATVRVCYSNPPAHGGLIVKTILSEPTLEAHWRQELAAMCGRIVAMRQALVDGLAARGVNQDFSYIKRQKGMFSFSGLADETVAWLRECKAIYVVGGGRINVAGLTSANIDYVCDSIAEALRQD
ncbi:amino acid aminotransferase [Desulfofustis limnaeus]|jgi:aspartate/tyrosine/aromatic aminotransferase|uniref:Aromatic amino acid aminotransferase n=1 Tax=Desulfofustis limnaeus TaxID=2740163 RepID=A0ABM7W6J6_9BACT|nr:amino acid aminotransferase [Desulfofustis limnaeus]MDX9894993.1 amino acid aminotransferase [Desulfofustis sp.]BDD86572.1 aromatic amino acid aminotransferase [Desulfofustis limnaeus]